ncbi:NAD(P)/FAD-dependent oxidoreductase [Tetragenococcus osmophilus]|uniref:Glutathione reductase n=1 Tax=Tetragenococcus osmophilus TaxID=526944 RepID=A0AA37XJ78_9ENTE|nr:NAD(P)/FAD-dependent oxidoreductase [Tetragenococcus osmophilus]AYW48395.1 NAD(P)/FAD-dependent oxidoreductase [Tetragenococcus osmophilus]GMA54228.1 glutathione reductase [Alicyclobacillus contaminans]GMA71893.1 glutathione reductase [Tetragenococcus osmophilus]
MVEKYDTVVIGAGPAGTAAASSLKAQGQKVAIVEEDLWGGTCPNRGCDPKKILYTAVEAKEQADLLAGQGLNTQSSIEWPDLMANKRNYTKQISPGTHESLKNNGIETITGHAQFVDQHTLEIGQQTIEAQNVIIATGLRPRILDIKGKEFLQTSNEFLDLDEMPESITILGGGYVAFELAGIASSAGAKVTLIHHNNRPLKAFPEKLVQTLCDQLSENGVEIILDQEITEIQKDSASYRVIGNDFDKKTDIVFAAVGRIANVDQLGLDQIGVEYSSKGVKVNEHLQSDVSHFYAVGDSAASPVPKLTPVAGFEANYVVDQILGDHKEIGYPLVPTIIFSLPKLSQVGVTAQQAEEDTDRYQVRTVNVEEWITYKRQHEKQPLVQLVIDQKQDQVVGAACLSMEADEMINYLRLLIKHEYSANEVSQTLFNYPTIASDIQYLY